MKNLAYLFLALILFSCGQEKKETTPDEPKETKTAEVVESAKEKPMEEAADEVNWDAMTYPFKYNLNDFKLVRRVEKGGGDCWGSQCTFTKGNTSLVADSSSCGEYHSTFRYYLLIDGEVTKYHYQRAEVDFEAKEGEGNYLGRELLKDVSREPAITYERSGRLGSPEFGQMKGEFTESEKPEAPNSAASLKEEMISGGIPYADHFIVYTEDKKASPDLLIAFGENGKALYAKYDGMKAILDLRFESDKMDNQGAYPTMEDTYTELDMDKENGTYVLTHSGNWDYATYTRGKDGKTFQFTIDHDRSVSEGGGFISEPPF